MVLYELLHPLRFPQENDKPILKRSWTNNTSKTLETKNTSQVGIYNKCSKVFCDVWATATVLRKFKTKLRAALSSPMAPPQPHGQHTVAARAMSTPDQSIDPRRLNAAFPKHGKLAGERKVGRRSWPILYPWGFGHLSATRVNDVE